VCQVSTSFIKTPVQERDLLNTDKRKKLSVHSPPTRGQRTRLRYKPVTHNFSGFTAGRAMYLTRTKQLIFFSLSWK